MSGAPDHPDEDAMTDLAVHDVRLFPKCPLDGTTATSADLELPGPVRTLAWAGVIDDAAPFGVHILIDSDDVPGCAANCTTPPRAFADERDMVRDHEPPSRRRRSVRTLCRLAPCSGRRSLTNGLHGARRRRGPHSAAGEGELRSVQPAIPRGLGLLGSNSVARRRSGWSSVLNGAEAACQAVPAVHRGRSVEWVRESQLIEPAVPLLVLARPHAATTLLGSLLPPALRGTT